MGNWGNMQTPRQPRVPSILEGWGTRRPTTTTTTTQRRSILDGELPHFGGGSNYLPRKKKAMFETDFSFLDGMLGGLFGAKKKKKQG
jgi:hypothetical protein